MPTLSGFTVVLADRVKETTQTTGTGTYSLDGAATGFRTFVAGVGSGNRTVYTAALGSSYEIGIGTVTTGAPATLSRDAILVSSNSNNAVSWAPGVKDIFCDAPAALTSQIFPVSSISTLFGGLKVTTFTSSGTWTRDAKCLSGFVEAVGGGGGGGGAAGGTGGAVGGCGGAGEYRYGYFTAAQLGASRAVTIGTAGAGGTAGANNGGAGGATILATLMTANGGLGGSGSTNSTSSRRVAGGAGGTGGTGGIGIDGGPGSNGVMLDSLAIVAGSGGGSFLGSGAQYPIPSAVGLAATVKGCGGSGAANEQGAGTDRGGGNGAAGWMRITEYLSL